MPGAYAHMTLANCLRETQRLDAIPGFPADAIRAVLDYFEFVELGAVSPDYPYLAIGDSNASRWADAMHDTDAGEMIRVGIDLLKELNGEAKRKGLAWLLGYTSHVVADMTIHPVVELKVGPYDENKQAHRVCEMNQDAHVFERLNLGPVGLANHLRNGIARCGTSTALDADIVALWSDMLSIIHPDEYASNPPDLQKWHRAFLAVVNKISKGQRLLPLARHVAVDAGLIYPSPTGVSREYLDGLEVPGGHLDYDALFEKAIDNACAEWRVVAAGLFGHDNQYVARLGEWNLDTGRDAAGNLVYWG